MIARDDNAVVDVFAREVRRRRETEGLTLNQLAARAGLTPNYIGTIESGDRNPSLTTVIRLAEAFRIKPGEFFDAGGISPAALEVGRRFDLVPEPVKKHVEALIRFFSSEAKLAQR